MVLNVSNDLVILQIGEGVLVNKYGEDEDEKRES